MWVAHDANCRTPQVFEAAAQGIIVPVQCDQAADPASLLVVTTQEALFPNAPVTQIKVITTPLAEVLARQVTEVQSNATQIEEIEAEVAEQEVKGSPEAQTGITVIMSVTIILVAILIVALLLVALVPAAAGHREVSAFFRRLYGLEDPAPVVPEPSELGSGAQTARTTGDNAGGGEEGEAAADDGVPEGGEADAVDGTGAGRDDAEIEPAEDY